MDAKHTVTPGLPLRHSSHRQIVSANGGLVCEVFSGSLGIEGADAMQELIVRACNAHDDLVNALQFMLAYENDDEAAISEIQEAFNQQEEVQDAQEFARCYCARKMRAAIAKAGAA